MEINEQLISKVLEETKTTHAFVLRAFLKLFPVETLRGKSEKHIMELMMLNSHNISAQIAKDFNDFCDRIDGKKEKVIEIISEQVWKEIRNDK